MLTPNDGGGGASAPTFSLPFLSGIDLGKLIAQAQAHEVRLVEEAIDKAIKILDTQLDELNANDFRTRAHIPKASFGGSPGGHAVAQDHTRAFHVTIDTIQGVHDKLIAFRDAIHDSAKDLRQSDEAVSDHLRSILMKAEAVDLTANDAVQQSQQENAAQVPASSASSVSEPVDGAGAVDTSGTSTSSTSNTDTTGGQP